MKVTMRKAALATAGLAVTGGVIFGATDAFASGSATSPTPAASATTSGHKGTAKCKDAAHPARCAARHERSALLRRGAHGQSTVKNKAGDYVVREWQSGTVESISGSTVTVTDGTNTTWTWTVAAATKYRVDGAKGALTGVHVGDTVLIRGVHSGSANDAAAVVDPDQSKLG